MINQQWVEQEESPAQRYEEKVKRILLLLSVYVVFAHVEARQVIGQLSNKPGVELVPATNRQQAVELDRQVLGGNLQPCSAQTGRGGSIEAPQHSVVSFKDSEVECVAVYEDEVCLLHALEDHRGVSGKYIDVVIVGRQSGPQGHIIGDGPEGIWESVELPGLLRRGGGERFRGGSNAGSSGGDEGCLILGLLVRVNYRQSDDDGHGSDGRDQPGCGLHLSDEEALLHGSPPGEQDTGRTGVAIYALPLRSSLKL